MCIRSTEGPRPLPRGGGACAQVERGVLAAPLAPNGAVRRTASCPLSSRATVPEHSPALPFRAPPCYHHRARCNRAPARRSIDDRGLSLSHRRRPPRIGRGPLRGRRSRARACCTPPCCARAMPTPGWSRSTPSAPSSCPACARCSPPPTCPRPRSFRTACAPPRAPSATCSRPSPAEWSATWASPWRWSWPTIRYVAADALERIDVVYEPLPACASVADALAPGAPRLFPGTESNNVAVIPMRVGDAERALDRRRPGASASASRYPRQTAAALETRGLVAVPPDPRGGELHLIGSTKCIHINRTILAPDLRHPARRAAPDRGGRWRGLRRPRRTLPGRHPGAPRRHEARPPRPVDRGARRETLMATNHAREVEYQVEIGFDADGRILGLRALIHADIGAYVRTAALVPAEFGAALFPGPYRVPSYHVRSLVGGDQQDAGGHAPLARAARVQLRPRAPDGPGRGAPRPRSR